MVALTKENQKKDKQTLVQIGEDGSQFRIPDVIENLRPDANIISDIYKKIENVEEEQNEIIETLIEKKKRRKTSKITFEEDEQN